MSRLLIVLILISLVGCDCQLDTDFESDNPEGKIAIGVIGNNDDGSVSNGGFLDVEIVAEDHDGVDVIFVSIPSLGIEESYYSNSRKERFEIQEYYQVDQIDLSFQPRIEVTFEDDDGNQYVNRRSFRIK